jgi:hypothetical protein
MTYGATAQIEYEACSPQALPWASYHTDVVPAIGWQAEHTHVGKVFGTS